MIAKGNPHGSGPALISYLLTGQEGERAEFISARGFENFGPDLMDAAAKMQAWADRTTNVEFAWFHTQTRLAPGEQLTPEQWEQVFDREEKRLGFTGHARVLSFHIDEQTGERHGHAAWFRLDPESGEVRDPGLYKLRLNEVARKCEIDFGLRQLDNERQPGDRVSAAERKEMEESRRLGTDVKAIRNTILNCLEQSDGGKSFKAALDEKVLMLSNGDRRDCFVVIDQEGGHHALNKKLTGMTLAAMRERMADLDRSELPSVEQAKEIQRERQQQRQRDPTTEIDRQAGQAMQEAHAAAKGRTDAIRPAEPAAPIWDRDAETRAADDRIIEAAIKQAASAPSESRQPPEPAAIKEPAEAPAAVSAQPAATTAAWESTFAKATADRPDAARELAATADAAVDIGAHAGEGILRGLGRLLEGFIGWLADSIAPPPTRDQAERMAHVAEEKQEARAEQEVEVKRDEQHWLIIEALKQAREREDKENEQESARERERDRGYERDW